MCRLTNVPSYNLDFLKIVFDTPDIGLGEQTDHYARGHESCIWSELCITNYTSLEALMRDTIRVEFAEGIRFNPIHQNNGPFCARPLVTVH
jgi:hypothetical protein